MACLARTFEPQRWSAKGNAELGGVGRKSTRLEGRKEPTSVCQMAELGNIN